MGLGAEKPLSEAKPKAPNSDYHKDASSVAAEQPEVARGNLKRAAGIDELNGHLPGRWSPRLRGTTGAGFCWSS